ncbi:MAG TPA: hypothetical protein VFF19_22605 [Reyranella sp.]|nr:hypothetical protein [Reyranella sp.]
MNIIQPHRGLVWGFEVLNQRRELIDRFTQPNKVPTQGLDFMIKLALNMVSPVPAWYFSLFEGDYTPTDDVTAATLPGLATEITAYTPSTRPLFEPGAVAGGSASNAADLAEVTFTAEKTVRVVAMSSASAKGSTAGILLSVVRLPSPRTYPIGSILRAFGAPTAVSAN